MKEQIKEYRALQKHLNKQPVGFPATKSGSDIRLLKHIFSPLDAQISLYLNYKGSSLSEVYSRAAHLVASIEELQAVLDALQVKGGLEAKKENGEKLYALVPLVVGMYEFQLERLTPEFIKDFKKYTNEMSFGIEYLSTELPQMRTIPIGASVDVKHNVSPFDEVSTLMNRVEEPFVIVDCICRKKKEIEGRKCKTTDRKETCMAIGSMAESVLDTGVGRQISREKAISILDKNQQEGLILQPSNTENPEFICSCCGCCCGILSIHKSLPKPLDFWASNYFVEVNESICNGCSLCISKCQVKALKVVDKKQPVKVDLNYCLGCGVCVVACPKDALELNKKPKETIPPDTREALYETIMKYKKGPIGKLKVTGKLVYDSIKTKNYRLFR